MGLISAIKSVLGMDDGSEGRSGTDVTVEREPDATNERAVKESEAPATGELSEAEAAGEGATGTPETPGEGESMEAGEPEPEPEEAAVAVEEIKGIGPAYAERLADAGVHSVGDLAEADAVELGEATGISETRIEGWIERAKAR